MEKRKNIVTMGGNPMTLLGPEIRVGMKAPDFKVIDNSMNEISLLERDFYQDIEDSTEVVLKDFINRSIFEKIKESFTRLLSPIL